MFKKPKSFLPSWQEILQVYYLILVVSNILAFLGFAYQFNSLILKLTAFEIFEIVSIVFTYPLIESLFVIFVLVIISLLLPNRWLKDHFSIRGSILYLSSAIFLYPWFGFTASQGLTKFYVPINNVSNIGLLAGLWVGLFFGFIYLLVRITRKDSSQQKLRSLLGKLSLLGKFYMVFNFVSLVSLTIRMVL